jgi:hypothetical protein
MQQENTSVNAGGRTSPAQATSIALRSLGQMYDINIATARALLQAQARAVSAFGWPDLSNLFDQVDERTRHVFSTSAEQLVQVTQRTNDAALELQQQVGRVVQTQAATMAESLQHSLQEIGEQTGEGLRQLCDNARLQAEEAERVAKSASAEFRDTLREGSAHARQALREGGRQFGDAVRQSGEQANDLLRQGGQQAREGAQRGSEAMQRSGEAASQGMQRAGEAASQGMQRAGESASQGGPSGNGQDGATDPQATPGSDERAGRRKNPPQAPV